MITLKKEFYKNIKITYYVHEDGTFTATALGFLNTRNRESDKNNFNAYPDFKRCEIDIKSGIDTFLSSTPTNYEDLAAQITSSLTWTSYEECHLDEQVCKIIIENFIKATKDKEL